jgi:NAD(P)-dependent dehydrogenase (short-subunit alcohol dehydrogenase family)
MNLHLSDKHVLITGGSKGIGLACAHAFLEEGARVTLVSRDAANLNNALQKLHAHFPAERIHTVAANLRDAAHALTALNSAEAAFGPVDVLVNSAGAAKRTPAPELTPEAFADAMQAKYFTTIHMLTPTIQRMAARGQGAVVNIVGNGGKVASPIHMPGGAANAALMLVSAGMAAAYGPQGIRVNAWWPMHGLKGSTPKKPWRKRSPKSPWAAWPSPKKSPMRCYFWPHPKPATSPAFA